MRMSNYPHGFNGGVLIRNIPNVDVAPGKVFYVGNNATLLEGEKIAANNDLGGKGGTFLMPFATIDYAVGRCAADRGDVILVRPGHVETISAAGSLALDVAGIKLVGLGHGTKMCKLNFTATAGTVTVTANNVQIINMNFTAGISAVVMGLSIVAGATDCLVDNCRFDTTVAGTDEFNRSINVGVGCDRLVIEDCKINMGIAGAVAAISLVGATNDVTIQRNTIQGDYSTGNITSETTASTRVHILDNLLINGLSTDINSEPVLECTTLTTSGIVARNYILADLATQAAATVGTDFVYFENFRSDEKGAGITGHTSSATILISADA
jgi:hypothetical protein